MSEHTPGPWRVEPGRETRVGADIVIVSRNGLVAIACTIHEGAVNAEANARLIAAAPEMLAALEAAEALLNEHEHCLREDCTNPGCVVYRQARAAIAKARGGAEDPGKATG